MQRRRAPTDTPERVGRGASPRPPVVTSPPLTLAGWLRHDAVRRVLGGLDGVRSMLEIGAGEGAFGTRLAAAYDYTGLEPDPIAFAVARRRLERIGRVGVVNGSLESLEPGLRFDLVCAFEVLEHLDDPVSALEAWRGRTVEGGWLLLTVPAGERRFGAADRRVGHLRRYEPEQLEHQLLAAGLTAVRIERFGFPLGYLLEPARSAVAAVRPSGTGSGVERTSGSGRWLQPPDHLAWATRAATAPFRKLEAVWRPGRLGTSLLALARNPPRGSESARVRSS